jgi:hypothetical protein
VLPPDAQKKFTMPDGTKMSAMDALPRRYIDSLKLHYHVANIGDARKKVRFATGEKL